MKQGALIFDERSDRYDIRFDLADYYGGLHCGETFDVMVGGRWKPTRIEYGDNWYLVGIRADDLAGGSNPKDNTLYYQIGQADNPSAASGGPQVSGNPKQGQDQAAPRPAEPKAAQKARGGPVQYRDHRR